MTFKFIAFLILNFIALGIGGIFTKKGVPSEWYQNLPKAPWTPPGWVFGAAWTTIMICFAWYMAQLYTKVNSIAVLLLLFSIQWILNVGWTYIFFNNQQIGLGLFVISLLLVLLIGMAILYLPILKGYTFLIAPYIIWLCIATSLQIYIQLHN